MQTQLVYENTLFRLEPSEVCFERILYLFYACLMYFLAFLRAVLHATGAFFPAKKAVPDFLGHVQIEKSVFSCVFDVLYVLFNELSSFVPALDIAAGAFLPQQQAVPDLLDMSKLRNQCFYAFLMHPMCFSMTYQASFLLWTLPQAPFFPSKRRSQILWTCPN